MPTAESSICSETRGSRICVCPTTEANLGDGFLPVARVCHRSIGMCIGSDSNVRIDPLEELRELEGIARRQTGERGVISGRRAALRSARTRVPPRSVSRRGPTRSSTSSHPQLRGVDESAVYEALVFSCTGDVLRKTSDQ